MPRIFARWGAAVPFTSQRWIWLRYILTRILLLLQAGSVNPPSRTNPKLQPKLLLFSNGIRVPRRRSRGSAKITGSAQQTFVVRPLFPVPCWSQTPHLDGRAASKRSLKLRGVSGALRMVAATLGDHLRNFLGMEAVSQSVSQSVGRKVK